MSEQPEIIQATVLRNIGCCSLAAGTVGRRYSGACVNWEPPKPEKCKVCQDERWTVRDGLCQTCRFVAHCEGYE